MKLLDHFVVVAQRRRLGEHTIECYLTWVRQVTTFCASRHSAWKHPAELGTVDVEAFLNDLVLRRRLSASSQNQALCAVALLYRHVLDGVIPNQHLGKFLLERSRRVPCRLAARAKNRRKWPLFSRWGPSIDLGIERPHAATRGEVFHVDSRRESHDGEPARPRAGPNDDRFPKIPENARSAAIVSTARPSMSPNVPSAAIVSTPRRS